MTKSGLPLAEILWSFRITVSTSFSVLKSKSEDLTLMVMLRIWSPGNFLATNRCLAVFNGTITVSSKSAQAVPPFASNNPITVKGTLFIRITSSIGLSVSNKFFWTVFPIMATLEPELSSSSSKLLPFSNFQLPKSK